MTIIIDNKEIGLGKPPYMIAELSANHNGDIKRAIKTIDKAKEAGAHAIKLQTYTADTMTINSNLSDFMISNGPWKGYKLYDLYKWAETPFEWHQELFEYAHKREITIFSTPFDESAVDLLENLNVPAYKLASFEITDLDLIKYIGNTKKPVIMSTGLASENEIEEAIDTIKEAGCSDLILLHCISSYPSPIDQSNLMQIPKLKERFDSIIGLSDHSMDNVVAIASIALGACVIEKHFTLNRNDPGPDSQFSFEPQEFKTLCKDIENTWKALKYSGFNRQDSENNSRIFRRSIYFVKDIKAGSIITSSDIKRIRPNKGLPPKYFNQIIGKKLKKDVLRGTATSWNLIDE